MPWPKDPVLRAAALEKHRAAQRARWERPEERQRARDKALAQFAVPGAREKHSALKKQQYVDDPSIAERIAAALTRRAKPAEDPAIKSVRRELIKDRAKAMRAKKDGGAA